MRNDLRTAQVLQKDGNWMNVQFMSLRKGDRFRLVEPEGELVDDGEEAIASADPYVANGTHIIRCDVV